MTPKRIAIIDLGTNTFHLLVVDVTHEGRFRTEHRQQIFTKLGEEGVETIGAVSYSRGMAALATFKNTIDELKVERVTAIGTAALRTASNGMTFVAETQQRFGITIQLIDGIREAHLIYKGVRLAMPFETKPYLLMDIGGGSVEFIIANHTGLLWAQSYPIGVSVLYRHFRHQEPILSEEIQAIQSFINEHLSSLYTALKQYPVDTLVGASGTFDVLDEVLAMKYAKKHYAEIPLERFEPFYQRLLHSTRAERLAMPDVPDARVDLIVVAVILIDFILQKIGIETLMVTSYALKEGVISELMDDK